MLISLALFSILSLTQAKCPNNCFDHGQCDKYSKCHCSIHYEGADCSLKSCPKGVAWNDMATGTDAAHAVATCSNRGFCDYTTGLCTCEEGFTGHACERLDCFSSCSNNGQCISMYDLATYHRDDLSAQYTYGTIWDAHKISGCVCDPQFTGYDCSLRVCPNGDDPLTPNQVNAVQLVRCIANTGTFVLYYKGYPSRTIKYSDNADALKAALLGIPILTDVAVTFSQVDSTVCSTDANIISIEFLEQFGVQPPLVAVLDAAMAVSGQVSISADGVSAFTDFSGSTFLSVVGTKEQDSCAFRGICSVADGTCLCFATNGDTYGSSDGYGAAGTRGDCGFITSGSTVSSCPGGIQCSGHGVCDETRGTFRCTCSDGWESGDCSERSCPKGLSWFSYPGASEFAHYDFAECSNMGNCDTSTGTCVCRTGFSGAACEYMTCGGGNANPCNGHGKCLDMYELSQNSERNGELLVNIDPTYKGYGFDPNNEHTWDAHRIRGCICDEGYGSYDCGDRTCPVGDDPGTYDDHPEVQLLKCVASGGTFTLTFRNLVTPPIPWSVTSQELSQILGGLKSVGMATVTFVQDGLPPVGTLQTNQRPQPHLVPVNFNTSQFENNGTMVTSLEFKQPVINVVEPPMTWNMNGTALCDTSGNQVAIIQFDKLTGDIPSLRVDTSLLTDVVNFNGLPGTGVISLAVDGATMTLTGSPVGYTASIASVKGTTETAICNNRGICDVLTGVCNCFEDWYSSDGDGHPGNLGDCGFRKDHTGVIAAPATA